MDTQVFFLKENGNGRRLTRANLTHYTKDSKPKIGFAEKDAVRECYRLNSKPTQTHKAVAYKCPTCGMFHIGQKHAVLTNEDREDYARRLKMLKFIG